MIRLFKGKVVCPRCHGNGLVFKACLKRANLILYICDECDSTWERGEDISTEKFQYLFSILDKYDVGWENLEDYGYDWYTTDVVQNKSEDGKSDE